MVRYLGKRFLRSILTLLIILSIVFILVRQMPIDGYFPNIEKMTEAQIQNGLHQMGLDQPILVQLYNFFKDLILHGNLGVSRVYRNNVPVAEILAPKIPVSIKLGSLSLLFSMLVGLPMGTFMDLGVSRVYRNNVPVAEILAPKIPVSIKLGSLSLLFSMLVGLPMGTFMAKYKGKFFDNLGAAFIVLIQAVPSAVYYLFIQLYGTEWLGISMLFKPDKISSWILPVFSMSLGNIAYYAMWLRRYMVDESKKDYVTLARIKGVSENKIFFGHVFRNAFVPLAQYLPTSFLNTVIGSIYIESLYSIPGMGGLLVDVVKKQDNAMVLGIVLLYATVGIIGLLLGDLMMALLDPRINLTKKGGER